jgi:hypothetical protein
MALVRISRSLQAWAEREIGALEVERLPFAVNDDKADRE